MTPRECYKAVLDYRCPDCTYRYREYEIKAELWVEYSSRLLFVNSEQVQAYSEFDERSSVFVGEAEPALRSFRCGNCNAELPFELQAFLFRHVLKRQRSQIIPDILTQQEEEAADAIYIARLL